MPRFPGFVLIVASTLLPACATTIATSPPASPASSSASSPASPAPRAMPAPEPAATFDWPAARDRIVAALGKSDEISVGAREDGALQLLLPGTDAFSRGGVEPQPALKATLDRIAAVLAPVDDIEIDVVGHTDSIGRELLNLELSIERAEAVAEHLRSRGIALARLHADGKGEADPVADNATEAGRAKNRRVEILVRPHVAPAHPRAMSPRE